MSAVERRILTELRRLHETEARLQATYETLPGRGFLAGQSFLASLNTLNERVNHLENLLERVA